MAHVMAIADQRFGLADQKGAPVDLYNAALRRRIFACERSRRVAGLSKQLARRISPPNSD